MKHVFGVVAALANGGWGAAAVAQTDRTNAPTVARKDQAGTAASTRTNPAQAPPARQGDAAADIVVNGRRTTVTRTDDGVNYDQRQNAQAQAGSAADVLNTVPSVTVSPDGAVTLRGSGNVQLYVNGRPTNSLEGENRATTLQSMSGDSVASVEVITNPSARMDANGGAIINLILKKDATIGPRATVTANAGDRRRGNIALDSSYGWRKAHVDLDASFRDDVRLDGIFTDRSSINPSGDGIARSTITEYFSPTHRRSGNVRSEVRYALTPASDIGATVQVTRTRAANVVRQEHVDFDVAAIPLARYTRVRDGRLGQDSRDLTFYLASRGTPQEGSLRAELQDGVTHVRSDRTFDTVFFDAAAPRTLEYVGSYTDTRLTRAAIDFEKALGRNLSYSIGAEWKHNKDRFRNDQSDLAVGAPLPQGFSGPGTEFSTVQNIKSAYVNLRAKLPPWTLQAGLRARRAAIDFASLPASSIDDRSIKGVNANLSIARDIGSGRGSLSLTQSQQLPDPRDLNPAVIYLDPQNRRMGNPGLRPQQVTSVELGYDVGHGDANKSIKLYYRQTNDTIVDDYQLVEDGVLLNTKRNAGNAESYGAEVTVADKVTKDLKASATANVFHSELSFVNQTVRGSNSRLSYTLQASMIWALARDDELRLDANAQGPSLIARGVRSGGSAVNAVWRHVFSPGLSVSFTAQRFMQNHHVHTDIVTPTVRSAERRRNGNQALFVGLRYRMK